MINKILNTVLIFTLTLSTSCSFANESEHSLREKDCFSGSYDDFIVSLTNGVADQKKYNSADMYRAQVSEGEYQDLQTNFICRILVYKSDEHPIGGILLAPKISNGEKLTTVIFNRGGNGRFGALNYIDIFHQLKPIADLGIVVLASQYRGGMELTDGPGAEVDEFGGRDVQDVVNITKLAADLSYVDKDDIHMIGVSRGGMSSFLSLLEVQNIKSLTVIGAPSDLFMSITERPEMENVFNHRIPNYSENKDYELKKRSVVYWVEDIPRTVPILILHGSKDKRVDVSQAELLASKLSAINHPHKLVIYDDFHELSFSRGLIYEEIESWIIGKN